MPADEGETRRVVSGTGHEIAYDIRGTGGRAVILLCGAFMNRGRWSDAGYVDRLKSDFVVVTIDPLGHGESAKPHDIEAYEPAELVDHTRTVMDHEDIERAIIWGYSRGGRLAWLVAEAHPERVELMVLGGTPVGVPVEVIAPSAQIAALSAGDWKTFWSGFPAELPEPVKQYMSTTNDPKAMAAVLGAWATDNGPWQRPPVPTIGHLGDGEEVLEVVLARSAMLGIPTAVLATGGHSQTFWALDEVMAATGPYLAR